MCNSQYRRTAFAASMLFGMFVFAAVFALPCAAAAPDIQNDSNARAGNPPSNDPSNDPSAAHPPPKLPRPSQRKKSAASHKRKPTLLRRQGREFLPLDGLWEFLTEPIDSITDTGVKKTGGIDTKFLAGRTIESERQKQWAVKRPAVTNKIDVPAYWDSLAAPGYDGAIWYWREFDMPATWTGQTVRLRFEGVGETAQVWLNGQPLGNHTGGATPFEFDVTRALHFTPRRIRPNGIVEDSLRSSSNLLAVRVEGKAKRGAGIWQSVVLMAHDEGYITDCFPQPDGFGNVSANITILNTSKVEGDATLDARIAASDNPEKDVRLTNQNLHITPGPNQTLLLDSVPRKLVHHWTPDNPFLYLLQIALRQDKDVLDTLETEFGFRQFGLVENAVTIDTVPVKLTVGRLPKGLPPIITTSGDAEKAHQMFMQMKAQGITVVALEAPPSALLRIADAAGMLVIVGPRPHQSDSAAEAEMRDLIVRDRAHPSILAWNIGSVDTLAARAIRKLDPTRFLLVGSNKAVRLWLPGENQPYTGAVPPGLIASL